MTAVAERVARGTALLDERMPGWDKRIDLAALNISSACGCILGQLAEDKAGGYWPDIASQFGVTPWGSDADYGFNAAKADEEDSEDEADAFESDDYAGLESEWRALITERRSAP